MGEFLIENGVLKKYEGNGGDVIVPEGVITIGREVFANRCDIKSVVVPQGVTYLDYGVFERCINLERVVLPEGLEDIHNCIFRHCTSLVEVVLPDSLQTLAGNMFSSCTSLKAIKLPKNLRTMYASFQNCESLEIIEIPDSVMTMQDNPFLRCNSLRKIIFGKNTPSCEFQAKELYGCNMIEEVIIPKDNEHYTVRDNAIFTKNGKEIVYCFPTVRGEYVIPDGVEIIRQAAFSNCEAITNIVIPNSVKEIKREAFADCRGITTLVVPDSVEKIGDYAFDRDFLLDFSRSKPEPYTRISFGTSSGKKVGKKIIDFPSGDSPLVYPELPLSIISDRDIKIRLAMGFCLNSDLYEGEYAKRYQKYAKSQQENILEYASKINEKAVEEYYKKLEKNEQASGKSENPKNIKGIKPDNKKRNSMSKKTVWDWKEEWKYDVREFRNPANKQWEEGLVLTKYKGTETDVEVPEKIGRRAVLAIEWPAFSGNKKVTSVVIPESVKVLGGRIFHGCEALVKVEIRGENVVLCDECFFDCPSLGEVKIDISSAEFGDHIFQKCWRMMDEEGFVVLEEGDEKALVDVQLPVFMDTVVIPDGITRLIGGALSERRPWQFQEVDRIKTVVLPDTVKEIGNRFFFECRNLQRINLPSEIAKIGEEAFCNCRNLQEINISSDTCEIGIWAFSGCEKLPNKIITEPVSIFATSRFGIDDTIQGYLIFKYRQFSIEEEEWGIPEAIFKMSPEECACKVLSGECDTLLSLEYNQENNPSILKCICDMLEEDGAIEEEKAQFAVLFLEKIAWNYNIDAKLVNRLYKIIQNASAHKALEIFKKNKILRKIIKDTDFRSIENMYMINI